MLLFPREYVLVNKEVTYIEVVNNTVFIIL